MPKEEDAWSGIPYTPNDPRYQEYRKLRRITTVESIGVEGVRRMRLADYLSEETKHKEQLCLQEEGGRSQSPSSAYRKSAESVFREPTVQVSVTKKDPRRATAMTTLHGGLVRWTAFEDGEVHSELFPPRDGSDEGGEDRDDQLTARVEEQLADRQVMDEVALREKSKRDADPPVELTDWTGRRHERHVAEGIAALDKKEKEEKDRPHIIQFVPSSDGKFVFAVLSDGRVQAWSTSLFSGVAEIPAEQPQDGSEESDPPLYSAFLNLVGGEEDSDASEYFFLSLSSKGNVIVYRFVPPFLLAGGGQDGRKADEEDEEMAARLESTQQRMVLPPGKHTVRSHCVACDRSTMWIGTNVGGLHRVDLDDLRVSSRSQVSNNAVTSIGCASVQGTFLLVGLSNGDIVAVEHVAADSALHVRYRWGAAALWGSGTQQGAVAAIIIEPQNLDVAWCLHEGSGSVVRLSLKGSQFTILPGKWQAFQATKGRSGNGGDETPKRSETNSEGEANDRRSDGDAKPPAWSVVSASLDIHATWEELWALAADGLNHVWVSESHREAYHLDQLTAVTDATHTAAVDTLFRQTNEAIKAKARATHRHLCAFNQLQRMTMLRTCAVMFHRLARWRVLQQFTKKYGTVANIVERRIQLEQLTNAYGCLLVHRERHRHRRARDHALRSMTATAERHLMHYAYLKLIRHMNLQKRRRHALVASSVLLEQTNRQISRQCWSSWIFAVHASRLLVRKNIFANTMSEKLSLLTLRSRYSDWHHLQQAAHERRQLNRQAEAISRYMLRSLTARFFAKWLEFREAEQRRRILARWGTLVGEGGDQVAERWMETWRRWAAAKREARESAIIQEKQADEQKLQEAVEYMKPRLVKMKQLAQLRDKLNHLKQQKTDLEKKAEDAAAKVRPLRVSQHHEHALTSSTCTSYPPSQTSRRSSIAPSTQATTARNGPPLINKKSTKALLDSFVMLKENVVDLELDVNHVLATVDKARGPAALKIFTASLDTLQNLLLGNKKFVEARDEASKQEEDEKKEKEEEGNDSVEAHGQKDNEEDAPPPPHVTSTQEGAVQSTTEAAKEPSSEVDNGSEQEQKSEKEDQSSETEDNAWWPAVADSTAVYREDLLRRAVLEMSSDLKTQIHSSIRQLSIVSDSIAPQDIELEIGEPLRQRVVRNAVLMCLLYSALRH